MTQKLYQTVYADPGITRDGTLFDASTYIEGSWVRFYKRRPQKIGGYLMLNQGTNQIPRSIFLVDNPTPPSNPITDVDIYVGYQGSADISGNAKNAVLVYPLNVENNTTGAVIDRSPANHPFYASDPANIWIFDTIYGSDGGTNTSFQNQEFILAHVAPTAFTIYDSVTENTSEGQIYYGLAQNYSSSPAILPMMQNGTPFAVTTPARTDFQTANNGICVIGGYIFALNNSGIINWNTAFPATGVISDIDNKVSPFPTQYCLNYWNPNSFFIIGSEDFIYGAPVRVGADIGGLFWTRSSLVRAVKTPVDQSLVPQPTPLYLLNPQAQTLVSDGTLMLATISGLIPQQITINVTFTGIITPASITLTVNGFDQNNNSLADTLVYLTPGNQTTIHTYKTVTSIVVSNFSFVGVSSPTATSILSSYIGNNQDPGLYTWTASYVSTIATCLAARSIVSYEPFFFWVGTDTFYQYNGAVSEVVNETNKLWFFNNLNRNAPEQVTSFVNIQFHEWWILFPMGDAIECNWALVYNILNECWFDTPLNRSCAFRSNSLSPYPIMGSSVLDVNASPNYPIFVHEYGYDANYGSIGTFSIPSSFTTLLSLEANPPNQKNAITMNQVTLDLDQEQIMTLAVYKFAYPRSPTPTPKVYPFMPTDTFLTMSENGTILLLTFTSNAVGGYYLMGKTIVEYIVSDSEREEPT